MVVTGLGETLVWLARSCIKGTLEPCAIKVTLLPRGCSMRVN